MEIQHVPLRGGGKPLIFTHNLNKPSNRSSHRNSHRSSHRSSLRSKERSRSKEGERLRTREGERLRTFEGGPISSGESVRLIKPMPVQLHNEPSLMKIEQNHDIFKKDILLFSQTAQLEEKLQERLDNLKFDNSSLEKRLNLVVLELERVQNERDTIDLKVTKAICEIDRLQTAIDSKDSVDH